MKSVIIAILSLLVSFRSFSGPNAILENEKNALKIAEAYLVITYGEKVLEERPFKARNKGESWEFTGTLPKGAFKGGVATIEIRKLNGEVLNITHEK